MSLVELSLDWPFRVAHTPRLSLILRCTRICAAVTTTIWTFDYHLDFMVSNLSATLDLVAKLEEVSYRAILSLVE